MDLSDEKFEDFKRDLRSVLLAEKFGINIQHLNSEYEALTGNRISYNRVRFASLEDFLLTLSDTCYITSRGAQTFVCAVTTAKQKQLQELIRGQKSGPIRSYSILNSSYSNSARTGYRNYRNNAPSINNFNSNGFKRSDTVNHRRSTDRNENSVNYNPKRQTTATSQERRSFTSPLKSCFDVRGDSKLKVIESKPCDVKKESNYEKENLIINDNTNRSKINYDERYKPNVCYDVRASLNSNLNVIEFKPSDDINSKDSQLKDQQSNNSSKSPQRKKRIHNELFDQLASLFESDKTELMFDNLVEKKYHEKFEKPIDENWLELIAESDKFDIERLKYGNKCVILVGLTIINADSDSTSNDDPVDPKSELVEIANRIMNSKIE